VIFAATHRALARPDGRTPGFWFLNFLVDLSSRLFGRFLRSRAYSDLRI
jgi:hypothetical protein